LNKTAEAENQSRKIAIERKTLSGGVRNRALAGALICVGLLYLATLPWQRRMAAETARIESDNLAKQAEAARQIAINNTLESTRAQVERNPGDARGQLELAERYAELGRLDEAAVRAEIAVGLEPKSSEPLLIFADIQQRGRHYDAAMRAYKAALALSPDDARPRIGLAYLYISFGWPLEAEALLKPAVDADPRNPHLKVALALARVQHGDYSSAEKLLTDVRQIAPDDATQWSPLIHVYNEMGRFEEATVTARSAMSRLPYTAPIVDELGKAYYHSGDFPHAESAFRQAIAIQSSDLTAHYYRALTYQRTDQIPDAISDLEYVLRHNPDFEQTRQVLGKLYLRMNRTAEARKLMEEAGVVQARGQKHQRAGLLVSTKPNDPQAHWQMASVYYDEHNNGRALVEVRKTLELNPAYPAGLQLLAKLQALGTR
jgi:cytochrome c-type biogenesis protein CcmH/NrfG